MVNLTPASSKLERILPKKSKVNVSPLPQAIGTRSSGKDLAMQRNTSPILQPQQPPYGNDSTRNSSRNIQGGVPTTTTRTSSISSNTKVPVAMATPVSRTRRSHSLHYTNHPASLSLLNKTTTPPPLPLSPLTSTITCRSIPSPKNTANSAKPSKMKLKKRFSISSSTYPHKQASPQRSRTLPSEGDMEKPSPPQPSAAAVAALAPTTPSRFLSKAPVTHTFTNRPSPSIESLQKSRSTPLRSFSKIKTYNVSSAPPKPTPSTSISASTASQRHRSARAPSSRLERGLEKKKRQQELEDLISGRRGSTLKLSMTPKHTLLT